MLDTTSSQPVSQKLHVPVCYKQHQHYLSPVLCHQGVTGHPGKLGYLVPET